MEPTMKKLIIFLMLTGFSIPAHAGMLANLPSLVLAPFGDPCPDCKMSVISELYLKTKRLVGSNRFVQISHRADLSGQPLSDAESS